MDRAVRWDVSSEGDESGMALSLGVWETGSTEVSVSEMGRMGPGAGSRRNQDFTRDTASLRCLFAVQRTGEVEVLETMRLELGATSGFEAQTVQHQPQGINPTKAGGGSQSTSPRVGVGDGGKEAGLQAVPPHR